MQAPRLPASNLGKITHVLLGAFVTVFVAATFVAASTGNTEPSLSQVAAPTVHDFANGSFTCTIPQLAVVKERQQRIADAPTVEEARELALTPARAAKHALQLARLIAPSSEKLGEASDRLDGFEERIKVSDTPAAVAGEFGRLLEADMHSGNLVQVADLEAGHASVRGPGHCHYSTGEIIAIVFGFILFVIPGIILIFVLC